MANLTPEQTKVLTRILSIGRQQHATPKQIKAAVETGLVESNLTNPTGGDADSAGWRQERASLYPDPTNLNDSIRRFFAETAKAGNYSRAGDLAAAVQRPAAQYRGRYQQKSGVAQQLLRQFGAATDGTSAPSMDTTTSTRTVGAVDHTKARGALIASFLEGADPRLTQGTAAAGQQTTDPLSFVAALKGLADVPGRQVTTSTTSTAAPSGQPAGPAPSGPGYVNPFHGSLVQGGRVDEGLDPVIKGPIRAVGRAKVEAVRQFSGFGTYVAYRLLDGPQAGKRIYISEGIVPHVRPGQTVNAGDVIATGTGAIETGWAGGPAGSYLPVANKAQGGSYTEGAVTGPGRSFNAFLRSLGAHAGP